MISVSQLNSELCAQQIGDVTNGQGIEGIQRFSDSELQFRHIGSDAFTVLKSVADKYQLELALLH